MENKKRYILIAIIMMILVISVSTYAWLSYRSKETAMVLTIGEVGSISIRLQPYKFSSSIDPTITYEGNDYVSVTASNQSDKAYNIKLYYKINDIPEELIDESFKYTILRSSDGETYSEYDEGNFSNAESGSEYVILDEEKLKTDTEYSYKVYLWIEGSISDNTDMQGKVFDAELRADYKETTSAVIFTYNELSNNYSCANNSAGDTPIFTYTGDCEVVDDGDENWKVRFLSDGIFTSSEDMYIDAFLVGGGGTGGGSGGTGSYGGGGGGGYTNTTFVNIKENEEYNIVIGLGGMMSGTRNGGDTIAFGAIANGGSSSGGYNGGTGGSGGGSYSGGSGGSDGGKGFFGTNGAGGSGQEKTTCEFEEINCSDDLKYGGGGGGAIAEGTACSGGIGGGGAGGISSLKISGKSGKTNTGGGGGGGGGNGGSGIVVIRNNRSKEVGKLPSVEFDFEYTGNYLIINDGSDNWRIKFLSSGIFKSSIDLMIDAFLVGGGGSGNSGGYGGGGGGGFTNTTFANVKANEEYNIIVGNGSETETKGEDTIAFNAVAHGGNSTGNYSGGNGGSGGGTYMSGGGGTDGSDGIFGSYGVPGVGQRKTTCEFGEKDCSNSFKYSGGGGGAANDGTPGIGGSGGGGSGGKFSSSEGGTDGVVNKGGGGGSNGGAGGSGIVIIRNTRDKNSVEQLPSVGFNFEYTGNYIIANDGDGNWRIKFLTSGLFISDTDLDIDVFLVGGGGSGNSGGYGGGGGGGYTTNASVKIIKNEEYNVVVGEGGNNANSGENTVAFNLTANGGGPGKGYNGGAGGSGGGAYSGGNGGSNGENGITAAFGSGGSGQVTTTCEFEEEDCSDELLYAGGGGGASSSGIPGIGGSGGGGNGGIGSTSERGLFGIPNTGGGGGGGGSGASGGSGIVIIRNAR